MREQFLVITNDLKRRTPRRVKGFILDYFHNPARIYSAKQGEFPTRVHTRANPDGVELDPGNTRVAFHHIMKTAGSSFRRVVETLYKREHRYRGDYGAGAHRLISDEEFAKLRFVGGHFRIDLLLDRMPDALWLTFLRDPIQRTVSHYRMDRRELKYSAERLRRSQRSERYIHEIENLSFEEYVREDYRQVNWILDNHQTRVLVEKSFLKAHGNPACKGYDEAIVERAKQNLRDRYAFVGVQESYDESLLLFESAFGLTRAKSGYATNVNPTKSRSSGYDISDHARATLEERNMMDAEVHRYATQLMHEHADALSKNKAATPDSPPGAAT